MSSQPTVTNIRDALDAAQTAKAELDTLAWWRGHPAILDWRLIPSVYRTEQADYLSYERNVSGRFVAGAASRHANLPEPERRDQWLVLMQHYGLPTRLLDWTHSVLIAIYFAVRGLRDENGRLFALSPARLNDHQFSGGEGIFDPAQSVISELFLPPFRHATNPDKIAAFFPTEVDTRMLLQQSVFTVHGPGPPIDELEYQDDILMKWDIPSFAKATLLSELSDLGLNESTLYPDLEHLAKHIASALYL